jgi:hypothetical protein
MPIENNNININLCLDWFDVSISGKRLEIVAKDGTDILHFDFENGNCNLLTQYGDTRYIQDPRVTVTQHESVPKVFFAFMAILRNRSEHFEKH